MKYHLDRAIECNPEDNVAWTLLGHWYFEVRFSGCEVQILFKVCEYSINKRKFNETNLLCTDNYALFQLADLSRLQRRWSRTFARVELPAGSYKKALACFEKSDSIKPWVSDDLNVLSGNMCCFSRIEFIILHRVISFDYLTVTLLQIQNTMHIAKAYLRLRRKDEALEIFRRFVCFDSSISKN